MNNFDEVVAFLEGRYGARLHIFYGGYSLHKAQQVFSNAHTVIGVHGGAFYNIVFCPLTVRVIEFLPVTDSGESPGLSHAIFWMISVLLNQTFWRVPVIESGAAFDINVTKLNHILDISDNS